MIWFILLLIPGLFFLVVWAKLPTYPPYEEYTPEHRRNLRRSALFLAVLCLVLAFASLVM